jgi:MoxR-like ATPase
MTPETQKFQEKVVDRATTPIAETEHSVAYLGVELPKGKGGDFCPKRENYQGYINEEFSLELQRKIATSWKLDQPILIEGGTSIGKTTTVRKMCAELGYEVYYKNLNGTTDVEDLMGRYVPNPDRKTANDPEYKWADGPVTQGLRQDSEKIKVIILDEYNSANPNIVIRLHEVLDELEKNGEVVLAEDASERVKVGKTRTKVIALTNPPGKGYLDRQPLDPAQLRRWNYQKEVSELPKDTFSDSVDIMFHLKPETKELAEEKFLRSSDVEIPIGELREVPGMKELIEKYKEFHHAAKELLKNRKIAQDQPQAFMYDDRMEPQRVLKFIQNFYRGDINAVWKEALGYFYVNKLEDGTDKQKLLELINAIEYSQPVESRRKGLEREGAIAEAIAKAETPEEIERLRTLSEIERVRKRIEESGKVPDGFFEEKREGLSGALAEQIKNAKEILGKKDVLGIEEIENTFGIKVRAEDVPHIPFSKEDLEKAKELGQFLILRVDKAKDGTGLSMKKMHDLLAEEFKKDGHGKILASIDWYKEEEFFTKETPKLSWALTSKEVIPDSTSKNYLQQTEGIIDYIKEKVFKGGALPKEYQDAIKEFAEQKEKISKLMKDDWQEATKILEELRITKLTRKSPSESVYDFLAYFKTNKERLLENMYTWTSRRASDGKLVLVGPFDSDGANVDSVTPDSSRGALGVAFSRSL